MYKRQIQFYLHRDGTTVWLGLTEQHFNENSRWCGGSYDATQQQDLFEPMKPFVQAITDYLHAKPYFGMVGFDVLKTSSGEFFLVDLNPRLTGITPFLMASRIFDSELGHQAGVYQASCNFDGGLDQLIATADATSDCRVLVLSAFKKRLLADKQQPAICRPLEQTKQLAWPRYPESRQSDFSPAF